MYQLGKFGGLQREICNHPFPPPGGREKELSFHNVSFSWCLRCPAGFGEQEKEAGEFWYTRQAVFRAEGEWDHWRRNGKREKTQEPNVWCCSGREGNLLNNLHSTVWGSKIQTKKWSWAEPWERQTSLVTRKKHFSEDIEIEGNNVIEEEWSPFKSEVLAVIKTEFGHSRRKEH